MTKRRLVLLFLAVAIVGLGWVAPAKAAGGYAEAPMRVVTKGLTAEQHLARQAELSLRLVRELPAEAAERAVRVPLTAAEVAAVDRAPRTQSPLRVGIVKAMLPAVALNGADFDQPLRRTADGGVVWAAVVRSEDAGAIRLHIQDLSLPRGAELHIYSRDGQAYGPYVGRGPNFDGDFWATAIFGNEAIVQVKLAREADLASASLRIPEAGLITRHFVGSLTEPILPTAEDGMKRATAAANWPCGNINCLVDATCSNVAAANPAKLAVAKMEWISGAFIYTCTGGLLSDTNPTQDNFFLTANHCVSKNNNASNVSFYWRYATSSCNGTCPANNGWPYVTTGSTVSATNRKGDFTLLHLNSGPPAGSVQLGWTSAPVANTNNAQLYRISNPNFGPQVYSQHNVDTSAGTCSGWPRGERIYSRDITGAIDGGSSGSPILNASSQVVGQLSGTCGTNPSDACASGPGEANATVDGAFAFYFNTVKPFLNP
ncbi:MAG TPA: trypsin-like peptidase domain-containing protein [Thermoanaerobaculia bacterium]|nr:trypsin-like peptidase domain-containing protein [Thermoanaerobaculia bacterium]